MREILFRGKRIDNGEWVEGHYFETQKHYRHYQISTPYSHAVLGYVNFEVDPKTVGQYTGLTDKNGKKIFEGDIVNILAIDKNRVVRFDEGGFCLDAGPLRDYRCFGKMAIKVIGNIHDNPELLEAYK